MVLSSPCQHITLSSQLGAGTRPAETFDAEPCESQHMDVGPSCVLCSAQSFEQLAGLGTAEPHRQLVTVLAGPYLPVHCHCVI